MDRLEKLVPSNLTSGGEWPSRGSASRARLIPCSREPRAGDARERTTSTPCPSLVVGSKRDLMRCPRLAARPTAAMRPARARRATRRREVARGRSNRGLPPTKSVGSSLRPREAPQRTMRPLGWDRSETGYVSIKIVRFVALLLRCHLVAPQVLAPRCGDVVRSIQVASPVERATAERSKPASPRGQGRVRLPAARAASYTRS